MKTIYTIIATLLVSAGTVSAQAPARSLRVDQIKMIRKNGEVTVSFTLDAGKKSVKAGNNLVVNPVLEGTSGKRELPPIVIRGWRAKIADLRHELATGTKIYEQTPLYMAPGESVNYTTTLPYEAWMRGGNLAFDGVNVGCCSATEVQLGLIADNVLYAEPMVDTKIVEHPVPIETTGDRLARQYPFIAPATELARAGIDYDMPLDMGRGISNSEQRFIDETREGSISIYFRQGSRAIDRNYVDNNKNLVELISAVRTLTEAEDTGIVKIVIAGFTSPEGGTALNERLAWNRAVTIKEFLTDNSGIDPQSVILYNGVVDWTGLRALVAGSNLRHKERIIEIIDDTPVWDAQNNVGRLGELMRLDGGEPYRYMSKNFFPKLRQAAYIKVYYQNNTK